MAADHEPRSRRFGLSVIYGFAAALLLAPSIAVLAALRSSPGDLLAASLILLFNPLLFLTIAGGSRFAAIAWQSGKRRRAGRCHLRAAESISAVLGTWLVAGGIASFSSQARSAAHGGGLLGGFGELLAAAGCVLLLVAIGSRVARMRGANAGA
jgi:hypothetical protein